MSIYLQGPPPDPSYNFLSDRTRDRPRSFDMDKMEQKENRGGDRNNQEASRRHPKNFGGTEFSNVKTKMKVVKEKQVE